MELNHQFEVAAPIETTWPAFLDMPRVAPCMPGAEITEVIDETNVKGGAKVKVGPVNLRFAGKAEMTEIDHAAHSALMVGQGSDAKGRGNAAADVRFTLADLGDGRTNVDVHTTLNLTGSVAQYGRASGLIDEIANQMIAEFVQNLEAELGRDGETPSSEAADETDGDASAPKEAVEPVGAKPASGLTLFFRAVFAMIKKKLKRS
jgi:carbon monoxide dehydrogenase subunit G